LHYGNLADAVQLTHVICHVEPDDVYNLAPQSHVRMSFDMSEHWRHRRPWCHTSPREHPEKRHKNNVLPGVVIEDVRSRETTPDENTTFYPRSPYTAAKHTPIGFAVNYPTVTRPSSRKKITRSVAAILAGKPSKVYLDNFDAKRNWIFT
jgi:GDPmannose 4,6-dehydratase